MTMLLCCNITFWSSSVTSAIRKERPLAPRVCKRKWHRLTAVIKGFCSHVPKGICLHHILNFSNGFIVQPMPDFRLVDQVPPLPEGLQRALLLNPRTPSSILSPAPVTMPAEKAFKEPDSLITHRNPVEALNGVTTLKPIVPGWRLALIAPHS